MRWKTSKIEANHGKSMLLRTFSDYRVLENVNFIDQGPNGRPGGWWFEVIRLVQMPHGMLMEEHVVALAPDLRECEAFIKFDIRRREAWKAMLSQQPSTS